MSSRNKMPLQVWVLTLAAFAIGTAKFVIADVLTQIANALSISNGKAEYLITAYALTIVIGGAVLTFRKYRKLAAAINPDSSYAIHPDSGTTKAAN